MTDSRQTPPSKGTGSQRHTSTSPSGTRRHGRRGSPHQRPAEKTTLERLRTPVLALVVIGSLLAIGAFAFTSATAPAYACSTVDTVKAAAEGQLGQVQPDQGAAHVQTGDKVTYPVCPPASGKHVNRVGFGPLEPQVYGPDDQSLPTGWVHNLEHGGLVLLYSCDKGACDETGIASLQGFDTGFPSSAVCNLTPGTVGPVVARFEEMPTRYAALVWNRVLYLDTLDTQQIYDFYLRYGERVEEGRWVAPPEPQCAPPSPSAGPSAAPSSTP